MDLNDLQKLTAQGESSTLEFKKSTGSIKSAAETLCGFLNAAGGQVIIGVSDDQKILGQVVTDKTRRDIAHAIATTDRTLRTDLTKLEQLGLVARRGEGSGTIWRLIRN